MIPPPGGKNDRIHPLTLATAGALVFGGIDVSLAVVARPPLFAGITQLFPPLAAASLAAFLVILFAVPAARTAGRLAGRPGAVTDVAAAAFLVVFLVVLDYGHTAPFVRNPYRLLVALGVAATVASALVTRRVVGNRLRGIVLGLPVATVVATAFQWLFHYRAGGGARTVLIAASAVLAVAVSYAAVTRLRRAAGWVVGGLFGLVLLAGPLPWGLERRTAPCSEGRHAVPRVILLTIDTLRADVLGCFSRNAPPTPNIDAFAADCIRFDRAFSAAPWTVPAVTSIMTGLPASVHGVVAENMRLPDGLVTLAERMRGAGYATGAVVKNSFLSPAHGFDSGFQTYALYPRDAGDPSLGTALLRRLFPARYREVVSTDETTDLATAWITRNASLDFFFWLHIFDPHADYAPPARFQPAGPPPPRIGRSFGRHKDVRQGILRTTPEEDDWIRELYKGEVRYVDEAVGRLFQALRQRGLYDDALIILTSDHGEEFKEHGAFDHGHTLYNELLHVPLLVKLPGNPAPRVAGDLVSTQRLAATVLDVCGMDVPPDSATLGGGSLFSETGDPNPAVYSTGLLYFEPRESVVFGTYKYIRETEGDAEELYDLARDPGERVNIAGAHPEVVGRAREILDAHHEASASLRQRYDTAAPERFELDPKTIERLKALGYL